MVAFMKLIFYLVLRRFSSYNVFFQLLLHFVLSRSWFFSFVNILEQSVIIVRVLHDLAKARGITITAKSDRKKCIFFIIYIIEKEIMIMSLSKQSLI